MRLGIDASNIRAGGTTTHLIEILRAARPCDAGFDEVVIWGGSAVLNRIEGRPWLTKETPALLEQAANPYRDHRHFLRAYWQQFSLPRLARARGLDILFVPGGMDNSGFHPLVTMSRNMLVFDTGEASRYGWSFAGVRLRLLRYLQTRTFRRADGLIFLTEYARSMVAPMASIDIGKTVVVPHGVSSKFCFPPRTQRAITEYSDSEPFKILYVSTVDLYKHQWHVIDAIVRLRAAGLPVRLDLVGPGYPAGMARLTEALASLGPDRAFVEYRGAAPYDTLHSLYGQADLKVFASSCENMPNILLEGMMAGLPIACSNRGPMPEVLGDAGVYFDPEKPEQIAQAIASLVSSPELRKRNATRAFALAAQYSWERCARETFGFLARCSRERSKWTS